VPRYTGAVSTLSIRNISKRFANTAVLKDVSLAIASGELFFILGPSGCGKSTLLRIIAGLESPDTGDVCMDHASLTHVPPNQRGIGMVFQSYALWPHLTVEQNVAFGLQLQKLTGAEVRLRTSEALELVRLLGFERRYPHELSGGQQQRVALARAIAIRPRLILLDEPLSNLDARLRDEIRRELSALHQRLKITMVYVTHDQEDALVLAHRIAILNSGRVEQIGSPQELYSRPRSGFVAQFLGDANLIPCRIIETADDSGVTVAIAGAPSGQLCRAKIGDKIEGNEAKLCVRPEALRLLPSSDCEPTTQLHAVVREISYRGSWCDVGLEVANGITLRMRTSASDTIQHETIGQAVDIGWRCEDAVVVP